MKKNAPALRRALTVSAAAALLSGCAGFAPVKDAPLEPYVAPAGPRAAVFQGMVNSRQVEHLRKTNFPQLNATERALIREINRDVNKDIRYLSDKDNYGWIDFAVVEPHLRRPRAPNLPAARYGDCEDYALTKKHRLAENGIHPSRLFVVRAKVPTGHGPERHAVLAVPEGSDWWILNNMDNRIESASFLAKWWDWEFVWPRFDEYQRLVRARNGLQHNGAARPRG